MDVAELEALAAQWEGIADKALDPDHPSVMERAADPYRDGYVEGMADVFARCAFQLRRRIAQH